MHPISLARPREVPAGGGRRARRGAHRLPPSRYAAEAAGQATRILQGVADHVGMVDGPLSMQFFWHPQDKDPCRCARSPGACWATSTSSWRSARALSIEELLLDLTYDRPAMRTLVQGHALDDFAGVSFVLNFHALPGCAGVVTDTSEAQAILARPDVLPPSMLHYRAGETIGHGKGARPYVARVFCHVDAREQADALTTELFEAFSVRDEKGRELVCRERLPFMDEGGANDATRAAEGSEARA